MSTGKRVAACGAPKVGPPSAATCGRLQAQHSTATLIPFRSLLLHSGDSRAAPVSGQGGWLRRQISMAHTSLVGGLPTAQRLSAAERCPQHAARTPASSRRPCAAPLRAATAEAPTESQGFKMMRRGVKVGPWDEDMLQLLTSRLCCSLAGCRKSDEGRLRASSTRAQEAADETVLTPRFYTTDFDMMEEMFSLDKNPGLKMEEFDAMLKEFKTDYNQTHFVRCARLLGAAGAKAGHLSGFLAEAAASTPARRADWPPLA